MSWTEIHIITTATYAHEISHQLSELGASAITLKDAGDQPIYEPSATTPRIWAETIVVGLFEKDYPLEAIMTYLDEKKAKNQLISFQLRTVEDEDWVRRSLDSFKPLQFGNRLWICPSWQTPPNPHAINVTLDPGLAFGTGTHPTTALCLEWLDQHVHQQALAIDYGCGSGILGIAAYKLGVKQVIAVDNDPQALIATLQNAEQNGIATDDFTVQLAEQPLAATADIVLANILAQPLITLAERLASLTKSKGFIVLSGILTEQAENVREAYSSWFDMDQAVFKDEWVRLTGIRR